VRTPPFIVSLGGIASYDLTKCLTGNKSSNQGAGEAWDVVSDLEGREYSSASAYTKGRRFESQRWGGFVRGEIQVNLKKV